MHEQGYGDSEIARIFKKHRATVGRLLKRMKTGERAFLKYPLGRGCRKKKLSARSERWLVKFVRTHRSATLRELQQAILVLLKKSVSVMTIRRVLYRNGYRSRVAQKKPYISAVNRAKRVMFAKAHRSRSIGAWAHVVYSDESSFKLFGRRTRSLVWRKPTEKYHTDCVTPTVKFGGGSLMVWGWMSASGVGRLYRVEGSMNQSQYISVLKNEMLPSAKERFHSNFIFQHDNAPCHAAKSVKAFLEGENITLLQWPPQSPDLSPIEPLWSEVDRKIKDKTPRNLDELWRDIEQAWYSIPSSLCRKLVESVPRRLQSTIANYGGPTRY